MASNNLPTPEDLLRETNPDLTPTASEIEIEIGNQKHKLSPQDVNGFVHSIASNAAEELRRRDEEIARLRSQSQIPQQPVQQNQPEEFSEKTLAELLAKNPREAFNYGYKFTEERKKLLEKAQFGEMAFQQLQQMQFYSENPDFPKNDPQAAQAVNMTLRAMNLPPTAQGFDMAWTYVKSKTGFGAKAPNQPEPVQEQQFQQPQYNQTVHNQSNPGYYPPDYNQPQMGRVQAPPTINRSGQGTGQDPISQTYLENAQQTLSKEQLKELIRKIEMNGVRMNLG